MATLDPTPSLPGNKNTGDTLSAAELNQIVTALADLAAAHAATVLDADSTPVNNSTTPVASGLAVPIPANATRPFSAFVIYSSSTAADITLDLVGPAGSTVDALVVGATANTAPGAGVGVEQAVQIVGTIDNGATAGDLELQFAQATADATDTIVHARSHLVLL